MRTDTDLDRWPPSGNVFLPVAFCLIAGIVAPLLLGLHPTAVLAVGVAGLVVGLVVGQAPRGAVAVVIFLVAVGAVVVSDRLQLEKEWFLTVLPFFGGVILGPSLRGVRRRNAARSTGGSGDAEPVLQAVWDVDKADLESSGPTKEELIALASQLDGLGRTYLSLFRQCARFDIGGDARGAMVVYQSDNGEDFYQLSAPQAAHGDVQLRVARTVGFFPRSEITDLATSLSAMSAWLESGVRRDTLTWRRPTRTDEVVRPPALDAVRPGTGR